jgi:membrane-bound lytic murein transglycosylase D
MRLASTLVPLPMNVDLPMKKISFPTAFLVVTYFLFFVANAHAQQATSDSPSGIVMPNYHYDYVPDFTYQEVATRIAGMDTEMPFELNDRVFSFIQYFTVRNREYMKMVLARKAAYFPMYEETMGEHGMPSEIQFLSIVESGLDPKIKSKMGAMGLWQFMPATGRMYGMQVNADVDDRMDPEKSTDAAAKYLKSLYKMFGNWEVALAAYNCGPGNVRKAIRRSGGKTSFWGIYDFLPQETRSYVPQFQAMLYILNHLDEHNLHLEEPSYPMEFEKVSFDKTFHLAKLAALSDICLTDLETLNPSIKTRKIPESHRSMSIRIPKSRSLFVKENLAWIGDSLSLGAPAPLLATTLPASVKSSSEITTGSRITYKVKSGDVLGSIASKHGVSLAQLKQANNLRSNVIRVGQVLYIKTIKEASAPSSNSGTLALTTAPSGPKTYTVRSGDTLWIISQKHALTIDQIKRLNNLNSSNIKPGQRLIVG